MLPMLGFLIFGLLELALSYQAKATLDTAAFEAARAGALNHARAASMRSALAKGMLPLYMNGEADPAALGRAYATTRAILTGPAAGGWLEIQSPTRSVFNRFRERQTLLIDGKARSVDVIPNDNLAWRSTASQTVSIGGSNVQLNIQDANLLKIRAVWCHRLIVPVVNRVLHASWSLFTASPEQRRCDLYAARPGSAEFYIPLASQALVRLQSPALARDLP